MNTDRRSAERRTTRGSVRVEIQGHNFFGTMRNLSQAGCMIEAAQLAAKVGARCEVTLLPGYSASGRIAWQLGEAIGISFLMPIPAALVRELALDDWSMRSEHRAGGKAM